MRVLKVLGSTLQWSPPVAATCGDEKPVTKDELHSRTETPFNPIDGPIEAHRWPIDGHRNFFRWASMDHRWPSMGFELSPSAWGQLWSIFGLNISNFNLLIELLTRVPSKLSLFECRFRWFN